MSAGHTPRKDTMSTEQQRRRRSNWVALGIVGAAVVAGTVVTTSGTLNPTASAQPASSAVSHPTPQPTKTASIKGKVVIKPELAATVTGMAAVDGKAQGPGEIAGPAVRFTLRITNTTGKTADLSHTVVNAYYGADSSPAQPLTSGTAAFPASLADGASATGTFVFTIPASARASVVVTVDTSVANPVVAFKGAAPA
jgi:hypothetical protein